MCTVLMSVCRDLVGGKRVHGCMINMVGTTGRLEPMQEYLNCKSDLEIKLTVTLS